LNVETDIIISIAASLIEWAEIQVIMYSWDLQNKGNNKITELRTILQISSVTSCAWRHTDIFFNISIILFIVIISLRSKKKMSKLQRSHHGRDFQLPVQPMPITTTVVSLNSVHGEVYSIQHCVKKFVGDLRQVCGFLWVLRFPPPIKLTATIQLKYCWKWH
jgi:hypothetical protein